MRHFWLLIILLASFQISAQTTFEREKYAQLTPNQQNTYLRECFKPFLIDSNKAVAFYSFTKKISTDLRKINDNVGLLTVLGSQAWFEANRFNYAKAITYYEESVELCKQHNLERELYIIYQNQGYIYKLWNKPQKYYEYLLRAYNGFEKIGFDQFKDADIDRMMYMASLFMYNLDDYREALKYLKIAEEYTNGKDTWVNFQVFNTIGLCYRSMKEYTKAIAYFEKAKQFGVKQKNSLWLDIAEGNIGGTLIEQGKFDEAMPYVSKDYETCKAKKDLNGEMSALTYLIEIDLHNKKINEALLKTQNLEQLNIRNKAETNLLFLNDFDSDIFDFYAQIYAAKGDLAASGLYYKKGLILKDSLQKVSDTQNFVNIQLKSDAERYLAKIENLEEDRDSEVLKRNLVITILLLLAVVAYLIYCKIKQRSSQEKELFDRQKNIFDLEIKQKNENLYNAEIQLKLLTDKLVIGSELSGLNIETETTLLTEEQEINFQKLTHTSILTDDNWREFKRLFEVVHPNFLHRLQSKYPLLTTAEIRLSALIRLERSSKETAHLLGVSIETIKKTRYRLRKKINIAEEEAVEVWVKSI